MDQFNPQTESLADNLVNILSQAEGVEASTIAFHKLRDYFWVVDVSVACAKAIHFSENYKKTSWTHNTALGTLRDNDGNAFVFMFHGKRTPEDLSKKFVLRIPMGRDGAVEMEWFQEHAKLATQALASSLAAGDMWYVEKDVPTALTPAERQARENGRAEGTA